MPQTAAPSPSRQRNPFLAALAAALLAGGITFAFLPTTYRCEGLVQVRPPVTPMRGIIPMWEQYVATQVVLLRSQRNIDMALASPTWLENGRRSNAPDVSQSFAKHLAVLYDGTAVHVTFTDHDPQTASAGVAATIDSYQRLIADSDPDRTQRKKAKLEELQKHYKDALDKSAQRISDLAAPDTPEMLQSHYKDLVMRADQIETELNLASEALDNWRKAHPQSPANPTTEPLNETDRATAQRLEKILLESQNKFQAARQETALLGRRVASMQEMQASQLQSKTWLAEATQSLEEVRALGGSAASITVLSPGDRPRPLLAPKLLLSTAIALAIFLGTLLAATLLPRRK